MRILLSAIYPYAFLLLYLIIPFDNYIRALPNILVAILVVTFPFVVKREDFQRLKSIPIFLFLGFLVYLCINSILSSRFDEDLNIIKKVMLAAGLAILYIPVNDVNSPNGRTGKITSAIIFSALAAIIFSIYNFVLITDATGSFSLVDSPQIIESLLIDRLYLGLLCTLSIVISFQAIKKRYHPNNNYYLANIFVNLLFIILIGSKIALISLFVLLLLQQFYGQRKIWKIAIASLAIVAVIGLFFFIKNERSYQNSSVPENHKSPPAFIENSLTYELRAVVWESAAEVLKKVGFTLTGIGFDETKDRLAENFEHSIQNPQKREQFIAQRYNTHNQFLDFYLSAGFLALILFLVFIAGSFLSTRKQFLPTAMISLLTMYCLVENLFNRQIGAYYIGFILIVLMTSNEVRKNNAVKRI